jgi:nitrogen fixation NifU-like protein
MAGLEDLYREIIIDHYRSPRNRGELDTPPATRTEGFNPLCGDEIVVYLQLGEGEGDDRVIEEIRIGGQGCSISQSSASMMSTAVNGKTIAEAREVMRAFKAMMSIHESALDDSVEEPDIADIGELKLGDLEAMRGVVKFPVRIKCATLSWNTLDQGISEAVAGDAV